MTADTFLWGAATSAHQTEGGNTNTDCWDLEHDPNGWMREPSGDACDSFHRWTEDMDLLAGAGFTDYRFSVEWARIEPAPGEVSRAALAHYRRMVDGALERGLRPMVTLHHFTSPRWFADAGGFARSDAAECFQAYVAAAAPLLDGVAHVVTINEPNVAAWFATRRSMAIGHQDPRLVELDRDVVAGLTAAHRAGREQLHRDHPDLQVGWSIACVNAYDAEGSAGAAEEYARSRQNCFVEVSADDDFVGVQAYTRTRIAWVDGHAVRDEPETARRTRNDWEWYPAAIGDAVADVSRRVSSPVIVTENGIATADDDERIEYATDALLSLQKARADGADVRGYFHWSLLDNYEWGSYTPTFGLVAVDRTTFARTPKPSLQWLGAQRPGEPT